MNNYDKIESPNYTKTIGWCDYGEYQEIKIKPTKIDFIKGGYHIDEMWPTNILSEELYKYNDIENTKKLYERYVKGMYNPTIAKVIFNNPATIVFWTDGTKTIVKCSKTDIFDEQTGLLMCITEKFLGNTKVIKKYVPKRTTLEGQTKLISNNFKNFGKAVSTKDITYNFPNIDKFLK